MKALHTSTVVCLFVLELQEVRGCHYHLEETYSQSAELQTDRSKHLLWFLTFTC